MSEIMINKAETFILDFINQYRNAPLQITSDYQQRALDSLEMVSKDQELVLTSGPQIVTFWGYFQNDTGKAVVEATEEKIQQHDFWKSAINPSYTECGICVRGFKSGKVFVSFVLHSQNSRNQPDQNRYPQRNQQRNQNQYQNRNKNQYQNRNQQNYRGGRGGYQNKKQNQRSFQPRGEQRDEIKRNLPPNAFVIPHEPSQPDLEEQTPEHVQEKVTNILNHFLENHGKAALNFQERAYDLISAYHQECVDNNMQISRSTLLSKILGFQRRCIQIMNIKDPKLIDNNFPQTFFSSDFNSKQFTQPMNCIAVSFKFNKENIGSLIVFAAFDQDMPAPAQWNDTYLTVSSKNFHPEAELKLSERLDDIRKSRIPTLAKMINDYRATKELPPIQLNLTDLSKATMNFVVKMGRDQAIIRRFTMDCLEGVPAQEAACLKASSVVNTANYLDKIYDELIQSDTENEMLKDWTQMAIAFYDHRDAKSIYTAVVFIK